MKIKPTLWLCLISLLLIGATSRASAQELDVWSAQRLIEKELKDKNVLDWAKQLSSAGPTKNRNDLLRRLDVFMRAGYRQHSAEIIEALAQYEDEFGAQLERRIIDVLLKEENGQGAYWLLGEKSDNNQLWLINELYELNEWELARQLIERLPQLSKKSYYPLYWSPDCSAEFVRPLIHHWRESGKSADEIDAWLVDRARANPRPWTVERIYFHSSLGNGEEQAILEHLAAEAKKHPQNVNLARHYVNAWKAMPKDWRELNPPDWLGEVCRLDSAIDTHFLAGMVASARAYQGAALLFQYSLNAPLIDEEIERFSNTFPAPDPLDQLALRLRLETRECLANCYLKLGKPDLVQPLMDEVAASRKKLETAIPLATKLASQTQSENMPRYRLDEPHRAIPLLEDAVRRLENKQQLEKAMKDLLRTYVRITEWIKAEQLLAKFDEENIEIDLAYWHGRLALNAASLGAKEDAMRLWRLKCRRNFSDIKNLELLATRGLKQELLEYYREMEKQHPDCWVPVHAVKLLKGLAEK